MITGRKLKRRRVASPWEIGFESLFLLLLIVVLLAKIAYSTYKK